MNGDAGAHAWSVKLDDIPASGVVVMFLRARVSPSIAMAMFLRVSVSPSRVVTQRRVLFARTSF